MSTLTINTEIGEFVLKRPNAGQRNACIAASEQNGKIQQSVFLSELLACCVVSHPFGSSNVKHGLNSLDTWDYDALVEGLETLLQPPEHVKKKLKTYSDLPDSETTST